jgi:hypothetical protein
VEEGENDLHLHLQDPSFPLRLNLKIYYSRYVDQDCKPLGFCGQFLGFVSIHLDNYWYIGVRWKVFIILLESVAYIRNR